MPGDRRSEEDFVADAALDCIHRHPFTNGGGSFFSVLFDDDNPTLTYEQPIPQRNRIKVTVRFVKSSGGGNIDEIVLKRFKQYKSKGILRWEEQSWSPSEPFKFSYFSVQKIFEFLQLLIELDLINVTERRLFPRQQINPLDPETGRRLAEVLRQAEGIELVRAVLNDESGLTSTDLVNVGYRKSQLRLFSSFLSDPTSLREYAESNDLNPELSEKAWQYFLARNEWIFGYGLDYRFLGILQQEAHVSSEDIFGRDGVIADFLMGSKNFTVLVEIKKPGTNLFAGQRHRSFTWKLSSDVIDAISQINEQKASWQVHAVTNASRNFDAEGNIIKQTAADPKCILLIGSDSSFSGTDAEQEIKKRTFELFRRDLRNVEILTFDELLERARFIVEHRSPAR